MKLSFFFYSITNDDNVEFKTTFFIMYMLFYFNFFYLQQQIAKTGFKSY